MEEHISSKIVLSYLSWERRSQVHGVHTHPKKGSQRGEKKQHKGSFWVKLKYG